MFLFKELSRQPSVTVIRETSLSDRIDAGYYHTSHLDHLNKVIKNKYFKLNELADVTKLSGFEFSEHFSKAEADSKEIPCVMSQNVRENEIDLTSTTFISEKTHHMLSRSQLKAGDVALSYTGHYRRAAVVKASDCPIHLGPNVCKLSPKNVDPYFVATYLNSLHGQALLDREKTISAQPTVNMARIRELPIFHVTDVAQKYIGDKVRQAEQLRAWAKRLEQASSKLFADALDQLGYKEKESNQIVRATLEDRLDPAFYDEKYSFFNESWFIENTQPLKLFIENGSYGVLPSSSSYGKGGVKFIRATDLKNANIDPTCFTYVPEEEVVSKAKVSEGDILMEIKGAISSCELAGAHLAGTYVNGSIFRFTSKGINNAYLTYFLSSIIKELYCERVSVNNIISYLDLASIHSLPVVRFENHIEELLARNLIKINSAKKYAFSLTQTAKTLVEALIEGHLTEQQLIQAQQALDDGDNSLDQAILSKLSSEGYAIDGATPLFSDIDELYRLLESAAQAEAEE